jgi:hypothetical protein
MSPASLAAVIAIIGALTNAVVLIVHLWQHNDGPTPAPPYVAQAPPPAPPAAPPPPAQ